MIGVETIYHPMSRIWHQQDEAETTVIEGEWTTTHRGEQRHKNRRELVHIVRFVTRRWKNKFDLSQQKDKEKLIHSF